MLVRIETEKNYWSYLDGITMAVPTELLRRYEVEQMKQFGGLSAEEVIFREGDALPPEVEQDILELIEPEKFDTSPNGVWMYLVDRVDPVIGNPAY